jgi:hypothetical protein
VEREVEKQDWDKFIKQEEEEEDIVCMCVCVCVCVRAQQMATKSNEVGSELKNTFLLRRYSNIDR